MHNNGFAVTVSDLVRKFGKFTAVDHISFSIKTGEIFGFLGPNGAGKSTTIKMLCGILAPTGGTGTVGGFDIRRDSEKIKRNIGYMSQKFSLYPDLTAEENMDFFAGVYGVHPLERRKRKDELCRMVGLQDKRTMVTSLLTGGWRQRLALSCALIHRPPIIFLDEPTSGVDPISRRDFWNIIQDLSHEGITTLVTTHYMEEAEYCQRLALINQGRLISQGTPVELRASFSYRIFYVECDNLIKALDVLSREPAFMETALWGSGLHVVAEPAGDPAAKIKELLEREQIALKAIKPAVVSLEDVFVYKVSQGKAS
ncbi:MAG: ABC transporter ATP-binding protein [Candidatus Eremiobacteraeota bacterium]|nr:ABC transporter ATP-binding protein [Candidatus Eremiobacteraeota bacterium]